MKKRNLCNNFIPASKIPPPLPATRLRRHDCPVAPGAGSPALCIKARYMDIHPPKRPIHSLKDFLRELVTIIAGILIALSFDGLVAWWHHRSLAHEATANIVTEVRENRKELSNELKDLSKMDQQSRQLIDLVHKLQASRNTPVHDFQLIWTFAELHATSWDTAARTGALSYMPYAQVKRYSEVYDLQHAFTTFQQNSLSAALDVEGLATLMGRDPKTLSLTELADAERKIGIAAAHVRAMQQLAIALGKRYDDLLASEQK
jgi:hypothetical protein